MFKKSLIASIAFALIITGAVFAKGDQLVMTGSTTVLPIAQACAEAFMDKNPNIDVTVRGGGSGVGIAALLDGTCDIGNSSRDIKSKEIATARSKGINPTDNIIAWDGIAIVVNKDIAIENLTITQLKDIYNSKIQNWKDVGGPNKNIVVVSRDVSSGTFEVFKEKVLLNGTMRDDALKLASNQAISTTISSTPYSIGYVGLGYIGEGINTVKINNVAATKATAKSKEYPISRSLHMFTNGKPSGITKQFIDFVLSAEGQKIVDDLGFVPVK
jgi:phosphate transport system substrate-binding protein